MMMMTNNCWTMGQAGLLLSSPVVANLPASTRKIALFNGYIVIEQADCNCIMCHRHMWWVEEMSKATIGSVGEKLVLIIP